MKAEKLRENAVQGLMNVFFFFLVVSSCRKSCKENISTKEIHLFLVLVGVDFVFQMVISNQFSSFGHNFLVFF